MALLQNYLLAALLLCSSLFSIDAFHLAARPLHSVKPFSTIPSSTRFSNSNSLLQMTSSSSPSEENQDEESAPSDSTSTLTIPMNFDEMIKMVSKSVTDASDAGVKRQIVRVLLPRDPASGQIGRYFEDDAQTESTNIVLVPPDETWQGGIMQLYRAAVPTCMEILRRCSRDTAGVPPRINEDRSVDESGVDGVGLLTTESTTNEDSSLDVSCFVQPTQESIDYIESYTNQKPADDHLILLVNPQWRNVDDALDSASNSEGFFGQLASFLGGKGSSLRRLDELKYQTAFALEGYVCKGGNIRLIKKFDSDWAVFAEKDDGSGYVNVGVSETRPTYQECDKMLDDKGVSLKYARDIGLAPKL